MCVSIDFTSGFRHQDFVEYFLGKRVESVDYGSPDISNLEQFRHLGKQWTELGEYYKNSQLSGIIILDNHEFRLLLNRQSNQVINRKEYSEFKGKLLSNPNMLKTVLH